MARNPAAQKGFLSRLLRNEAGNTLAITAAATLPLLGMIGGGIDASRLYLAKTRLQQACDAGALAGRKAQGGGLWSEGNRETANDIFSTNFKDDAYGTTSLAHDYSENAGTVTGTASVTVPMMVMKIFGFDHKDLAVTCDAEMRLPNTDIMFVLDVTGSMGSPPTSGGSTSKLDGLKTAVQCFYEVLMKTDTPADCGSTPSGGISDDIQVRFGFVPYNVNVNVGRLLPHDFMANNWSYQSREPTSMTTEWGWTTGTESSISGWGDWSSAPSGINSASYYSGWTTVSSGTVNINGSNYSRYPGSSTSSACSNLNTNNGGVGYVDTGNLQNASLQSKTNNPPTHPASEQVSTYSQSNNHSLTAYKYTWFTSGSTSQRCRLQYATSSYTVTRTGGQSTTPITWTEYKRITGWTYKLVSLPVSGLKSGDTDWNSSVDLPIGYSSVSNVKLSGSSTASSFYVRANTSVSWNGCVEERQTVRTSDFDPIPSDAYDMNIDMVPDVNDALTQWGPMLVNAVWGRTSGGNKSYDPVETTVNGSMSRNIGTSYCPPAARRLARYTTSAQKDDFVDYVNDLYDDGNTYHDIGLIWGARLMSPTGIFADDNDFTPEGGEIQRHLIFMTDGDTQTSNTNYTAYGVPWWDRRTTSIASAPTNSDLDNNVNVRFEALCTAIKNMNITLWVVNYGGGVSTAAGARLNDCASPNRYYEATSVTDLMTTFQQIAAQISQLRLTS